MRKTLLIFMAFILVTLWPLALSVKAIPSQAQINAAVDAGLAWLSANQNADGSWGEGERVLGNTAAIVLAFLEKGHYPGKDTLYSSDVEAGLEYIFSKAVIAYPIYPQIAGNPDTDGDTFGVFFKHFSPAYETGMCVMAIAASNAPEKIVNTGPCTGWSYFDVVWDVFDWWAYGQVDNIVTSGGTDPNRGGWDYDPRDNSTGRSDNSVSQWPILGMLAAVEWDITALSWVRTEFEYWLDYIQGEEGGSGYTAPGDCTNVGKTGGLLSQLRWLGETINSLRVQNAIDYINQSWYDAAPPGDDGAKCVGNIGDPYAMFSAYKGLTHMGVKTLLDVGSEGDWLGEYSQFIVDNQDPAGFWPGPDEAYGRYLTTGWFLTILQDAGLTAEVTVELPGCTFDDTGYDVTTTYYVSRPATGTLKLYKGETLEITVPITNFQGTDTFIYPVGTTSGKNVTNSQGSITAVPPGTYDWTAELDVAAVDGSTAEADDTASITVNETPQLDDIPDQDGPFVQFDLDEYIDYSGDAEITWTATTPPGWIVNIDANNEVTVIAPPNAASPGVVTFTVTATCAPGVSRSSSDDATFAAATGAVMSDLVIVKGVIELFETIPIDEIWIEPGMSFVTLAVLWQGSDIDLAAVGPDNRRIDKSWIEDNFDSGVTYYEDDTSVEIVIPEPIPGEWEAEIIGTEIPEGGEVFEFKAQAFSQVYAEFSPKFKNRYSVTEPMDIGASFVVGNPNTGTKPVLGLAVESTVTKPNGDKDPLILYDDGAHSDNLPDDGIYGNNYADTGERGDYTISILAVGTVTPDDGDPWEIARRLSASIEVDDAFNISNLIPPPDSEVRNEPKPRISAIVQGSPAYIDTMELTFDGKIVDHRYKIDTQVVSYMPDQMLLPGTHNITLKITDIDGFLIEAPPWSFTSIYDPIDIDLNSLQPTPDSIVPTNILRPTISAAILGPEGNIDKATIALTLDGVKVPHTYDPDTQKVSYTTVEPPESGLHNVTLTVSDILGNPVAAAWSFNIISPLVLNKASYDVLDTTLKLEFSREVMTRNVRFSGIGMDLDHDGEWDLQLSDDQAIWAVAAQDDPRAILINIWCAVPTTMSLAIASFVMCECDYISLILAPGAFVDAYNGTSLKADVMLEITAYGYSLGLVGDVTGDDEVTAYDAALILQSTIRGEDVFPVYEAATEVSDLVAGYGHPSDIMMDIADISGDGDISSYDASLALQKSAGLFASPGNTISNPTRKCSISIDNTSSDTEVSLGLDDATQVYSADIILDYSPQMMNLIEVSKGNSTGEWMLEYDNTNGKIRISAAGATQPISDDSLIRLKFNLNEHRNLDYIGQLKITDLKLNGGLLNTVVENLPEELSLLQNYPNPFNPETWIPYRLSEPGDVSITIYSISGQIVRELSLGHKMPGHYVDRSKAAYWDGKNDQGEKVSSGVYFYKMQAGRKVLFGKMTSRL